MRRDSMAADALAAVAFMWPNMMMHFDAAPPCPRDSLALCRRFLAVFCIGLLGDFNVKFGSAGDCVLNMIQCF